MPASGYHSDDPGTLYGDLEAFIMSSKAGGDLLRDRLCEIAEKPELRPAANYTAGQRICKRYRACGLALQRSRARNGVNNLPTSLG